MTKLLSINVLYRQPDTMSLYGIPYGMRPGQSPGDLERAGNTRDWVWLGCPGWWGRLTRGEQAAISEYLEPLERMGLVPDSPCEWSVVMGAGGTVTA